ncbi:hypothetical protein [Hyalangium rubrum]|uniref:DUF7948 domain-containing protein n=1 Tax=Hyalangium rubrum TaxID=3103134 RepID=A0ABU5HCH4_9BACT|nr:hypothetical protein [Hyalangium sp. s54d21]MDY7230970.1 hypothetical protein [Hyalangium sp. s54d21]
MASGLLVLTLAASKPPQPPVPPAPPGPPRPASERVVIAPAPARTPGRYFQHQPGANAFFSDTGLTVRLSPAERPARELRWGLVGAQAVVPQPLQPRGAQLNQLVGPPEDWRQGLPTWGALYYPAAAQGVDLWLESREGGVGYSLRAARGEHLRQVRLEWRGAQALRVADGGRALEVDLADGHLREEGLLCGQERADGTSYEVPCRYREVRATERGSWEYVIEVDVKEPGRPAWVDPVIQWSSFIGSLSDDVLHGVAVIPSGVTAGEFFVVGSSGDLDYDPLDPVPSDQFFGEGGLSEIVVSRFTFKGNLIWTTVIGGTGADVGRSVVIGAGGFIYVAGTTGSPEFRVGTGSTHQGTTDGFVARLKADDGRVLSWFQHVGGTGAEDIHGLTLGADGKLYAVGSTSSADMPGSGGVGADGGMDLFVSRLDGTTGAIERTLLRGGIVEDVGRAITSGTLADGGTGIYATGYTDSPNFPGTGQGPSAAGRQAVVLALTPGLNSPSWITFLGGTAAEEGYGVLLTPGTPPGRLLVVGTTTSTNFPLSPAGMIPGGSNAFLTSLDLGTGQPGFSAVIGGSGDDDGWAIAPGPRGNVFIGGKTTSPTLPIGGGFDMTPEGASEGYVIQLVPNGPNYVPDWGTFVGGRLEDEVRALGFGPQANDLIIGGSTTSSDILKGDAGYDPTFSNRKDMFLFSLGAMDLTPPVVARVLDGVGADRDTQTSTEELLGSWDFTDPDTSITGYEVGAGTAPGCTNIAPFATNDTRTSVTLSTSGGRMQRLTPGTWYYVTVRAKNQVGLQTTASSDGVFVLLPDGGPDPIPPPGGSCPVVEPPDAGMPDAGTPDAGGPSPGPGDGGTVERRSAVGWSCGTPGGPAGLVLLMLLALGLRGARRRS